jgi:transposase
MPTQHTNTELELKLLKENQELKQRLTKLETIVLQQAKQIKKLESRLKAYENAHTPSSKTRFKKQPKEPNGKLGAKKGHEKWKRQQPKPTETIEYTANKCPHCNHNLGKPINTTTKITEDIPTPQPIIVTKHLIHNYFCKHCNKTIVAKNNVPKTVFGTNTQTQTILLRFEDRLPLRKVIHSLKRQGLEMTNVNVYKITRRIAKKLKPEYEKQILRLRTSRVVNADETGFKINGINHWLWTFVGEQQTVYVIKRSRGHGVVEEILGKNFTGILSVDGHTAYKKVGLLQRCWAHIIRESKELLEFKHYKTHHENLMQVFKLLKTARAKPPSLKKRLSLENKLEKRLEFLCDALDGQKTYHSFAVKLRNAIPHLFTCLIHLFVKTTNNIAERALRELIVIRKIIGGLRNISGAHVFETIATMLTTWKQQGLSTQQQLKQHIG